MKKVCVLTTVHQAYDGRIYHKQCKSLYNAGYNVTLIAPEPDSYKEDGIHIVPIKKPKQEWKRWLSTFSLIKKAIRTKADIYHFHDPELIPVGVILRLLTRKPVVFDVHEHYPNAIMSKKYLKGYKKFIARTLYEVVERICLPLLSGIIYTTKEIGLRYSKYKSCKIENYPIKSMFSFEKSIKKDETLILYLGGITEIRGIRELIDAFSIVNQQVPESRLLVVGGFESKEFEQEIKGKVRELKLTSQITFIGRVPYEKVKQYMEKASVGVIPYLPVPNHLVCLPNKLFEYMAANIVVLASHFPHYREVVENSNGGYVINPESPANMADKIIEVLRNKTNLKVMQHNAREAFEKTYNWESEEKKLLRFYNQLLSK